MHYEIAKIQASKKEKKKPNATQHKEYYVTSFMSRHDFYDKTTIISHNHIKIKETKKHKSKTRKHQEHSILSTNSHKGIN